MFNYTGTEDVMEIAKQLAERNVSNEREFTVRHVVRYLLKEIDKLKLDLHVTKERIAIKDDALTAAILALEFAIAEKARGEK